MKLEKLSALAELVSAVAIVITLGYLAVQTQQNTAAVQATVRQSMLADDRELLHWEMEFPHVAPGEYNGRDLTADERIQVIAWLTAFIRVRVSQWLQYQNGVVDQETWTTYRAPLGFVLSQSFSRRFWQVRSEAGDFNAGFVDDVNSFLADWQIQNSNSLPELLGLDP